MITGIKINNVRNLNFDEYVHLDPLTIFLGKNSSGKSTFLRTFPLIKQSLEIKRSTPLLWYGNLVDFGSFDETLNKNSNKKEMSFSFKIEIPHKEKSIKKNYEIFSSLSIKKENDLEFISNVEINYLNNNFVLNFDKENKLILLKVNEHEYHNLNLFYRLDRFDFFPTEFINTEVENENKTNRLFLSRRMILFGHRNKLENKIFNEISELLEKDKKNTEALKEKIEVTLSSSDGGISNILKSIRSLSKKNNFFKILEKLDLKLENEEKQNKLKNLFLTLFLERILFYINSEIFEYFDNIIYIAPLRATAQRYYRIQGLDIENIDSTGSNLPIYLKNLDKESRENFSTWTNENFGFKPKLISKEGHISLAIEKSENSNFNLADTGFGFSQILPILLQIWCKVFLKNNKRRINFYNRLYQTNLIFFIEQPELHLHPAMQASLIDLFIKAIKLGAEKGIKIKFVLETHSEVIVNRIGRHIAEENFENDKIEIIIFENDKMGKLNLIKTNISEDGIISNWPSGFFEPKEIQK